jgi:hypothetical protein
MKDFMIDLETMDNGPTSAIVQIGAVFFDIDSGKIGNEILVNVNLQDEMDNGFTVNGDTIMWWMSQDDKTWLKGHKMNSRSGAQNLVNFLSNNGPSKSRVWSHSTFDAPIVMYHFNKHGMRNPVRYGSWYDLRTIGYLAKGLGSIPHTERPEGTHDALVDARYQVEWLVVCWDIIKRLKDLKEITPAKAKAAKDMLAQGRVT